MCVFCFSFVLFFARSWLNLVELGKPEQAFIHLFTHSFIQHLLCVRGNPVMDPTIGGCRLVGEIAMKCNISCKSAFGAWKLEQLTLLG